MPFDTPASPILAAAYHIVENVDDYPTLIRLSMTCNLFKDLVDSRRKLSSRLFPELEQGVYPEYVPFCQGRPDCWCNGLRKAFGSFPPASETSALALHCPNFDAILWLPYYGCHNIKRREEFRQLQSTLCFDLHSCQAINRRCEACFDEAWRNGTKVRPNRHGVLMIEDQKHHDYILYRKRRFETLLKRLNESRLDFTKRFLALDLVALYGEGCI